MNEVQFHFISFLFYSILFYSLECASPFLPEKLHLWTRLVSWKLSSLAINQSKCLEHLLVLPCMPRVTSSPASCSKSAQPSRHPSIVHLKIHPEPMKNFQLIDISFNKSFLIIYLIFTLNQLHQFHNAIDLHQPAT